MNSILSSGIAITWLVLAIVWVTGALKGKRTLKSQTTASRSIQVALMIAGYILLANQRLEYGFLAVRFVPDAEWIRIAGLLVAIAGAAFAIWARIMLGRNWSGRITLKVDHELIERGPYALARHPIYTGLLTTIAATALLVGTLRGVCAFVLLLSAIGYKMIQEERLMEATFPDAYPAYRRHVKALIPWIL
jgi:protein-S-isoprenylcysteine O-methyltransferase Ste14